MKFKLGQKVRFKRIVRRRDCTFDLEDCPEEFTKTKRDIIEFEKYRVGYVVGSRDLVFKLNFGLPENSLDVVCVGREWKEVYKVAYSMRHTFYVLEEDLKEAIKCQ